MASEVGSELFQDSAHFFYHRGAQVFQLEDKVVLHFGEVLRELSRFAEGHQFGQLVESSHSVFPVLVIVPRPDYNLMHLATDVHLGDQILIHLVSHPENEAEKSELAVCFDFPAKSGKPKNTWKNIF